MPTPNGDRHGPGEAAATSAGAPAVGRLADGVLAQIMARHDTTVGTHRD